MLPRTGKSAEGTSMAHGCDRCKGRPLRDWLRRRPQGRRSPSSSLSGLFGESGLLVVGAVRDREAHGSVCEQLDLLRGQAEPHVVHRRGDRLTGEGLLVRRLGHAMDDFQSSCADGAGESQLERPFDADELPDVLQITARAILSVIFVD